MIDKDYFFSRLKELKLFTSFTQLQVDTINAVINECDKQSVTMSEQIAYIFATGYHEAYNPKKPGTRFTPIREAGGEAYLTTKKYYPYVGMGLSQLTWDYNYRKESKRLGIDLMGKPELILEPKLAANSHVYCLMNGIYTGKKIPDYINPKKVDYINARRCVNGLDKADLIAGYAQKFAQCVKII